MALVVALTQVALALTVWSLLYRRWHALPLGLWVAGALALGMGATLFAADGSLPVWATHELASALLSAAPALRIAALRLDLGWRPRGGLLAAFCLLDFSLYVVSQRHFSELNAALLGYASLALWTLVFAWHAAVAGHRLQSRSGWLLAGVEAFFAATMLLRLVSMALGWTPGRALGDGWDFGLMVLGGLAAALYGNLGYLGLVLDRTSETARTAREAQLADSLRRDAAEQHASALQALSSQREQLLQTLAQEIRQPLHNASGALQAATRALAGAGGGHLGGGASPAVPVSAVGDPLRRAQDLLGAMHVVLDNTLAAATQLARKDQPLLVDTDLDFLLQLALGDLPEAQRGRVQLRWHTGFRSAELEPGLVRLALRNLLLHALAHGGPGAPVRLDVDERDQPPALLLQVHDDGQFWHTGSGNNGAAGLQVAQQVMAAHGGTLRLSSTQTGGLTATLEFPQPG
jgi:signal transduction histidine kinase